MEDLLEKGIGCGDHETCDKGGNDDHNAGSAHAVVPRCAHEKEMPEVSTVEPWYDFMNLPIYDDRS